MMRRMMVQGSRALGILGLLALVAPATADAQITRVTNNDTRQAVGVTFGWFGPRGEDARVSSDVLLANLDFLAFEIKDFNTGTIGGEWLVGVGDYLEAGVGVGYQRRTVPSVYRDVTFDDGFEIAQNMRLRVVPVTGTVRFLPLGRSASIQPYVGGGVSLLNWRYSEFGEFVDFTDDSIFNARYVASGNTVGPIILAGLRAPVSDMWLVGGELRYQRGEGDTKASESGLLGDKIDLGGWSANFGIHFRF
jgi:opacity protein-like surface antigen